MSELRKYWTPTGMVGEKPATHLYEYKAVYLAADVEQVFRDIFNGTIRICEDHGELGYWGVGQEPNIVQWISLNVHLASLGGKG